MNKGIWLPGNATDSRSPGWPPVGAFIPADAVFPGIQPTVDELKRQLACLSRTDALLWCARLNLIVSNGTYHDRLEKQRTAARIIFSPEELERIASFAEQARPENVTVFFRAQLLELIQWIAVNCRDLPGDGETFEDSSIRQAFGRAALIVSELWGDRVYKNFDLGPSMDETRRACLATMRPGINAALSGMDPLLAVARGRCLFLEHLSRIRPNVAGEFRRATGLPLETFFAIVAIIGVHYLLRAPDVGGQGVAASGLFDEAHFAQKDHKLGSLFQEYAKFACQTPEELAAALRESIGTYRGLAQIRGRPVLRTRDGRCIVMDPVFFAEHAAVGPLFAILGGATGRDREQCLADYGDAFERYCGQLLRRMYQASSVLADRIECPVAGIARDGSPVQIADACLNDVTEVVLFEAKSAWVADDLTEADDPARYLTVLRDRYARTGGQESPKGAGQLANSIIHLANANWRPRTQDFTSAQTIYPVLLCHDWRLEAPLHGWFLAREFRSALDPSDESANGEMRKGRFSIHGLIVLTINDLEVLERSVENFSLTGLLRAYSHASPDRTCDVHNYLSASAYGKKLLASATLAESALAALSDAATLLGMPRAPEAST